MVYSAIRQRSRVVENRVGEAMSINIHASALLGPLRGLRPFHT